MAQHPGPIDALRTYGLDYDPAAQPQALADQGIRASDRYVDDRDPLRARTIVDGRTAQVQLGVDPGTFFCGAQLAELLRLRRARTPPQIRVGFVHVPPDRETGPQAQAKAELHPRTTNLEMIAQVLAIALRGLTPTTAGALLLTGFGPFQGVADNPTHAFVRDAANLDRAISLAHPGAAPGTTTTLDTALRTPALLREYSLPRAGLRPRRRLRLFSALLHLAPDDDDALAGRYFDPGTVAASFEELVDACAAANEGAGPNAIISLGVDSSQSAGPRPPSFKIETQTRGWHRGGSPGRSASAAFQRDLDLAEVFMDARREAAAPLRYGA